LPLVILDKLKIEFVLEILIENAITYTPKDGRIGIAAIRKGDFIEIMVSDSGIGIVPRERRQLFRQFYRGDKAKTTDTEGMGLGLYIAKRIVLQNHGTISVRSAGRDKGAMFTVRFRV
jgi:signal transduction histidine kinase